MQYIETSPTLALMLGIIMVFGGCASTDMPAAEKPPRYAQQKLQSVDHWDNIANDVANRVQKTLEDRRDLVAKPIYVQQPDERQFSTAFYSLVRSRLVSKGMQVTERHDPNALMLEYSVQTIKHDSAGTSMPSLVGLGVGVFGLVTGVYPTSSSDNEVIIDSRMSYGGRYVMYLSHTAYINDNDAAMYGGASDPQAGRNRSVRVVPN